MCCISSLRFLALFFFLLLRFLFFLALLDPSFICVLSSSHNQSQTPSSPHLFFPSHTFTSLTFSEFSDTSSPTPIMLSNNNAPHFPIEHVHNNVLKFLTIRPFRNHLGHQHINLYVHDFGRYEEENSKDFAQLILYLLLGVN